MLPKGDPPGASQDEIGALACRKPMPPSIGDRSAAAGGMGSPHPASRGQRTQPYRGQSHNDPFYEVRFCISAMTLTIGSGETEVWPLNG
jgi:hypothetical protein